MKQAIIPSPTLTSEPVYSLAEKGWQGKKALGRGGGTAEVLSRVEVKQVDARDARRPACVPSLSRPIAIAIEAEPPPRSTRGTWNFFVPSIITGPSNFSLAYNGTTDRGRTVYCAGSLGGSLVSVRLVNHTVISFCRF